MPIDLSKRGALVPGNDEWRAMMDRRNQLSDTGRELAGVLWSIERYGSAGMADEAPAPIYTDLAWQLQTSKENARALRTLLFALIGEQDE